MLDVEDLHVELSVLVGSPHFTVKSVPNRQPALIIARIPSLLRHKGRLKRRNRVSGDLIKKHCEQERSQEGQNESKILFARL